MIRAVLRNSLSCRSLNLFLESILSGKPDNLCNRAAGNKRVGGWVRVDECMNCLQRRNTSASCASSPSGMAKSYQEMGQAHVVPESLHCCTWIFTLTPHPGLSKLDSVDSGNYWNLFKRNLARRVLLDSMVLLLLLCHCHPLVKSIIGLDVSPGDHAKGKVHIWLMLQDCLQAHLMTNPAVPRTFANQRIPWCAQHASPGPWLGSCDLWCTEQSPESNGGSTLETLVSSRKGMLELERPIQCQGVSNPKKNLCSKPGWSSTRIFTCLQLRASWKACSYGHKPLIHLIVRVTRNVKYWAHTRPQPPTCCHCKEWEHELVALLTAGIICLDS